MSKCSHNITNEIKLYLINSESSQNLLKIYSKSSLLINLVSKVLNDFGELSDSTKNIALQFTLEYSKLKTLEV